MNLPDIFLDKSNLTFQSIASANGYMVHVWSATENDDEKDSYFWRRKGTRPGEDESLLTFDSYELAWLDCCSEKRLLVSLALYLRQHGFDINYSDFGTFYWRGQDGISVNFSTAAEAVLVCYLHNVTPTDEETLEPEIDEVVPFSP